MHTLIKVHLHELEVVGRRGRKSTTAGLKHRRAQEVIAARDAATVVRAAQRAVAVRRVLTREAVCILGLNVEARVHHA